MVKLYKVWLQSTLICGVNKNGGSILEVCDLGKHGPVVGKAMGKGATKNSLMVAPEV